MKKILLLILCTLFIFILVTAEQHHKEAKDWGEWKNVAENTALPWQRFWGTIMGASDKSKFMGVRRQAWAKNLKQPQNFEYPVYRTVGRNADGMEVVEAIIENIPFANGEKINALTPKRMADETRRGIKENRDRLLNNHRYMTITDLGNDNYHFYDIWDTQPFLKFNFLPEKIRTLEASSVVGGKPFEWNQIINIENDIHQNNALWNRILNK